jgi:arylsulfatase A-like enzyme
LTSQVEIPPDPVLRFSIAASPLGDDVLSVPVEFILHVDSEMGGEVFSETVRGSRGDRWLDREADLSAWSGTRVSLTFETTIGSRDRARGKDQPPVLAVWGNPVLASSAAENEKPHLILVSIDCLRADHVGAYGYHRDTTPRIDELAKDGVVFRTAVSTAPWTLTAHMAMLTGLPPSIHGATRQSKLDSSVPYLPELLAQSGYRVDGIVSVPHLSQHFGFERGFHSYLFSMDPGADPYAAPTDFRMRFGERPPDISDLLSKVLHDEAPRNQEEIDQVINLYDGELAYVDQELGRFFDGLKAARLYERSLIVVSADHGEAFYEHGFWKHTQTLYEEMVRVPLIVKWPADSLTGSVETLVSQVDIFPTVLEAAGLDPPGTWATGLRRHVDRGSEEIDNRTVVTEVTWDAIPTRPAMMKISFRNEEFKYIATLDGPAVNELNASGVRTEELYDLNGDPSERENLLLKSDGELRFFREKLGDYFAEARALRAARRGEPVILDETVLEKLRSLGYVDR